MTDTPATAREFERWYDEQKADWPLSLQNAGLRVLLTLKSLDQPDAHKSLAFMSASMKDLMLFAVAYTEWYGHRGYEP